MDRYKWSRDELERRDIPDAAKEFLATVGLPHFTDYPILEFGAYESDGAFVIGECGSDPIIVKEPSGIVIIESEDGEELYMNAQVDDISYFIDLMSSGGRLKDVATKMIMLDPKSLESFEHCFWAQVYYDCRVQGFFE